MSIGYYIEKSTVNFDYNSPLYTEDSNLVFGLETKSPNALLFKAKSERTSKTILIELVRVFQKLFIFFQENFYFY